MPWCSLLCSTALKFAMRSSIAALASGSDGRGGRRPAIKLSCRRDDEGIPTTGEFVKWFYDQPRHREALVAKAVKMCELLEDPPLAESVHIANKIAQSAYENSLVRRSSVDMSN